jgi:TrmH family RNA methyltransferase
MNSMPGLKRLAKLKQKKHREIEHLFLVEGEGPIRESSVSPLAVFSGAEEVGRLSSLTTPTGPVAVFPFLDMEAQELLEQRDRVLLLDGVQDPGNVGTAIRSAHAFDAGVVLSRGTADLYNPKTVRATMGSIFHAPIAREVEPAAFLQTARESGFLNLAAVPTGGERLRDVAAGKVVLVVGTEGRGISEEVRAACDATLSIPSRAASLNAGVAASILLYEAYLRVLP